MCSMFRLALVLLGVMLQRCHWLGVDSCDILKPGCEVLALCSPAVRTNRTCWEKGPIRITKFAALLES
jgi:hypothetical protein